MAAAAPAASPVTAQGGVLPHIAIEVTDLPAVAAELKAQGIEVTDVPNGAKWKRI